MQVLGSYSPLKRAMWDLKAVRTVKVPPKRPRQATRRGAPTGLKLWWSANHTKLNLAVAAALRLAPRTNPAWRMPHWTSEPREGTRTLLGSLALG